MGEAAVRHLPELVESLLPAIAPLMDESCVFFGHSMGALVAFEVARALNSKYGLRPEAFIASGAAAPHCPDPFPIHALPTRDFLSALLRLNGMPPEVLNDSELLAYVLPILRADFALCESYRYVVGAPLTCPISVFGGHRDPRVSRERLDAWRDHAGVSFALKMFQGDHFFIRSDRGNVLNSINRELAGLVSILTA